MSTQVDPVRPPRISRVFLSSLLPSGIIGESILGDLEEEFRTAAERGSLKVARTWYRRQVLGVFTRLVLPRRLARYSRPCHTRDAEPPRKTPFGSLLKDIRYSVRVLIKNPIFTSAAVVTLALGIGATTAVFSAVNATLLRPLPFENPTRLMKVSLLMPERAGLNADGSRRAMIWSYPKYRLFRELQHVFENTATYLRRQYNLTDVDSPERLWGEVVGTSYFSVLGIAAELGRGFVSEETAVEGAGFELVLSHGFWVRRFGADPNVLGNTIHLDGTPFTVVGVMPTGFSGLWGVAEVWVPTSTLGDRIEDSRSHSYHVVARLEDGVSHEQAVAGMRALGSQIDEAFPDTEPWSATARPLDQYRVSDNMRTSVLILFGAAGLVLLTACVNVTGLLLGRTVARRREIATRLALGSSKLCLVRHLLTESLLVSVFGGVLGVIFAYAGVRYFNSLGAAIRFNMSGLERTAFNSIHIDAATLLFCIVVVTATALLAGLWPALRGSRLSLSDGLKSGTGTGKSKLTKGSGALVITQVALGCVLLVGSGLLVRTMTRLHETELGFSHATMLTVRVALPPDRYDRQARQTFFVQLLERVRGLPGVTAATFTNCVPFANGCRNTNAVLNLDGVETDESRERVVGVNFVSPDYFDALGLPVYGGRVFTALDREDTQGVVVISQAAARRFWPGEAAVGRSLSLHGINNATVIGVVGDVRYDNVEDLPRPNVYVSTFQAPRREGFLITRGSADPASLTVAIREAVRSLNADLPIFDVRTMLDRVDDETWHTRFATLLISLFASMALFLAAIGIYGVLAYNVERQSRDIGIKMALGATQRNALMGVVSRALALTTTGICVGSIVALLVARVLRAMLFETSPHDPMTFGFVALVFVAVALAASYFPARRASAVDPVEVLQAE